MGKKLTTEEFIERARKVHGDRYDYSFVEYIGNQNKVKILCDKHKLFEQRPSAHMMGMGCKKCADEADGKRRRGTLEQFIEKSIKAHGNKYKYTKSVYIDSKTEICISCDNHGDFFQIPHHHTRGHGCPRCSKYNDYTITTKRFIEKAILVHGDTFDYSLTEYEGTNKKIIIICKKHKHKFSQTASNHLGGQGCPKCRSSRGERAIRNFLKNNNIKFDEQKKFETCINPKTGWKLRFDFYLPDYDMLIEFDGEQHFKASDGFGGNKKLEYVKGMDFIKTNWCLDNYIKLLRIPYKSLKKVDKILERYLKN